MSLGALELIPIGKCWRGTVRLFCRSGSHCPNDTCVKFSSVKERGVSSLPARIRRFKSAVLIDASMSGFCVGSSAFGGRSRPSSPSLALQSRLHTPTRKEPCFFGHGNGLMTSFAPPGKSILLSIVPLVLWTSGAMWHMEMPTPSFKLWGQRDLSIGTKASRCQGRFQPLTFRRLMQVSTRGADIYVYGKATSLRLSTPMRSTLTSSWTMPAAVRNALSTLPSSSAMFRFYLLLRPLYGSCRGRRRQASTVLVQSAGREQSQRIGDTCMPYSSNLQHVNTSLFNFAEAFSSLSTKTKGPCQIRPAFAAFCCKTLLRKSLPSHGGGRLQMGLVA